jgi:hypothetical protein
MSGGPVPSGPYPLKDSHSQQALDHDFRAATTERPATNSEEIRHSSMAACSSAAVATPLPSSTFSSGRRLSSSAVQRGASVLHSKPCFRIRT